MEQAQGNTISLRNVTRILFKRKKMIILFFLSTVITVAIGTFQMKPMYRAFSTVMIDWEKENEKTLLLELNALMRRSDYDRIAAEKQILLSRPITEAVVQNLGMFEEAHGTRINPNGIDWRYSEFVARVQKSLSVEQTKGTNVLEVSFEDDSPFRAAEVTNCFVEQYSKYRAELAKDFRAYDFFDEQMKITSSKLDELEERQASFRRERGTIVTEEEAFVLLTKLGDYEKALTEVQTQRFGKEAKLNAIKDNLRDGGKLTIPSTETSDSPSREDYLTKLKTELLSLELQRNKLAQKFTAKHPQVVALEQEIALAESKLRDELFSILREEEINIEALRAEESVLNSKIVGVERALGEYAQNESDLNKISRGISESQDVYAQLLSQREEARISLAKQDIVQVKVISAATPPSSPIKPKKSLYIGLAVLFGLIASVGTAFSLEFFDHSIETADDVQRELGFPVLASVRETNLMDLSKQRSGKRGANGKRRNGPSKPEPIVTTAQGNS